MAIVDEIKIVVKAEVDAAIAKLTKLEEVAQTNKSSWNKLKDTFATVRDTMQGPIAAAQQVYAAFQMVKQQVDMMESSWASAAEASAILANTLRSTGADSWTTKRHLDEMAGSIQNMTKYEADAVTEMQGVLLGFRNITGKEFDKATMAILDMATVMKMDLTSAAQAVGKALDNPILGIDSLSKQGFKFTAQEKDLMKSMVEVGNIAGAQKIILDELEKTYGGASKAAGDLAVSLKDKLKNAQGDVNEEMGRAISEFLRPYREWMIKNTTETASAMKAQNDYRDAIRGAKVDYEGIITALRNTKEGRVANTAAMYQENIELDKQIEKLQDLVVWQNIDAEEFTRRANALKAATTPTAVKNKEGVKQTKEELDLEMDLYKAYNDGVAAQEKIIADRQEKERDLEFDMWKAYYEGIEKQEKSLADIKKEELDLEFDLYKAYVAGLDEQDKKILAQQKNLYQALGTGALAMVEALGDALVTGEDGWKGFAKEGVKAFAKIIEASAAASDVLVAQAIASALIGTLGGIPASIAYSLAAHAAAGALRAIPMAEGGSGVVTKPTLFLAGEAGPESFSFGGRGSGSQMIVYKTYNNVTQNVAGSIRSDRELQSLAASAMAKASRGY